MRRLVLVAVLLGACSDGSDAVPPTFRVRSPLLLTFEGLPAAVSLEVDGRARFSVIGEDGQPRGTGVAEQAGTYEVQFDPSGLPDGGGDLDVVGISDSGGRAEATVTVRHGPTGLVVLDEPLVAATLLTDDRVAVVTATGGVLLEASVGSAEFDGPLEGGARTVLAPGPDGDFFAGGDDDVIFHYGDDGSLCDTIQLLLTQTAGGDAPSSPVTDLDTQFGGGPDEVMAAHELGFSGFDFTGRPCAADTCLDLDECPLDLSSGFSTGTCLTGGISDFRSTAIAIDGERLYTGGYTLNVRLLPAATNQCVDLQLAASEDTIEDIAVSATSVWVAVERGVSRIDRDFDIGTGIARPQVERYGEGRAPGDGLDALPSNDVRTLCAVAGEVDGVWFGTDAGFGRVLRAGASPEVAWVSGVALPGREVVAILAPPDNAGLLWIATDGGLARLLLE